MAVNVNCTGTGSTVQLALLVANSQIPTAEVARAQTAFSLSDVNGQVRLQIGTDGALYNAAGTAVIVPTTAALEVALTDAATITWTIDPTQTVQLGSVTLGGNRTLAFSGTTTPGMRFDLIVTQDGTGGRTLALPGTSLKNTQPTTASAVYRLSGYARTATTYVWTWGAALT